MNWIRQLNIIALKGSGIFCTVVPMYIFYSLTSTYGMRELLYALAPATVILLLLLMVGTCFCLSSSRNRRLYTVGTVLLSLLVCSLLYTLGNVHQNFFDFNHDCVYIVKNSKFLTNFIDFNYEKTYDKGFRTLCSKDCPCKVNNLTRREELQTFTRKLNISTYFTEKENFTSMGKLGKKKGAISALECNQSRQWTAKELEYAKNAGQYERQFNCSGFCVPLDRYVYSDIERGAPHHTCFPYWRLLQQRQLQLYYLLGHMSFSVIGLGTLGTMLRFVFLTCDLRRVLKLKSQHKTQTDKLKKEPTDELENEKSKTD